MGGHNRSTIFKDSKADTHVFLNVCFFNVYMCFISSVYMFCHIVWGLFSGNVDIRLIVNY